MPKLVYSIFLLPFSKQRKFEYAMHESLIFIYIILIYPAYIIIVKTVDILYTSIKLLYETRIYIFNSIQYFI